MPTLSASSLLRIRPSLCSSDSILRSMSSRGWRSVIGSSWATSSALQPGTRGRLRGGGRLGLTPLGCCAGGDARQHQLFVGGNDRFLGEPPAGPVPGGEAGQQGQDRK